MKQEVAFLHVKRRRDVLWSLLGSVVLLAVGEGHCFLLAARSHWAPEACEGYEDYLSELPGFLLELGPLDSLYASPRAYWLCVFGSILVWNFGFCYVVLKDYHLLARAVFGQGDARWALLGGAALSAVATLIAFVAPGDWRWVVLFPGGIVPEPELLIVFPSPVRWLLSSMFSSSKTAVFALAFLFTLNWYFVLSFVSLKGWRIIARFIRTLNRWDNDQ